MFYYFGDGNSRFMLKCCTMWMVLTISADWNRCRIICFIFLYTCLNHIGLSGFSFEFNGNEFSVFRKYNESRMNTRISKLVKEWIRVSSQNKIKMRTKYKDNERMKSRSKAKIWIETKMKMRKLNRILLKLRPTASNQA